MHITELSFSDYKCFRPNYTRILDGKLITLIIGRNNSGKTQYLDIIKQLCEPTPFKAEVKYLVKGTLTEPELKAVFDKSISGGPYQGNHWEDNGRKLIDATVECTVLGDGQIQGTQITPSSKFELRDSLIHAVEGMVASSRHRYFDKTFVKLLADRDIRPEQESATAAIEPDGAGATNIIRRYL